MVEKWPTLQNETIADYYIFKVQETVKQSPRTQKKHTFFVLDSPDWVNVIPITAEGNVIMIHQVRHGTGEPTLEIPGGMVDEKEDPRLSAQRELLEETGYAAEQFLHIGSVTPNPAFLNNELHTFLALNARRVQQPVFDGSEDIIVEEIAVDQIPTLIDSGQIHHALVIAAFYHYERYRDRHR